MKAKESDSRITPGAAFTPQSPGDAESCQSPICVCRERPHTCSLSLSVPQSAGLKIKRLLLWSCQPSWMTSPPPLWASVSLSVKKVLGCWLLSKIPSMSIFRGNCVLATRSNLAIRSNHSCPSTSMRELRKIDGGLQVYSKVPQRPSVCHWGN